MAIDGPVTYEAWRITYQDSEQAARAAFAELARERERGLEEAAMWLFAGGDRIKVAWVTQPEHVRNTYRRQAGAQVHPPQNECPSSHRGFACEGSRVTKGRMSRGVRDGGSCIGQTPPPPPRRRTPTRRRK